MGKSVAEKKIYHSFMYASKDVEIFYMDLLIDFMRAKVAEL